MLFSNIQNIAYTFWSIMTDIIHLVTFLLFHSLPTIRWNSVNSLIYQLSSFFQLFFFFFNVKIRFFLNSWRLYTWQMMKNELVKMLIISNTEEVNYSSKTWKENMEGKWPYNCCFVGYCCQDLFKMVSNILVYFLSNFFSMSFLASMWCIHIVVWIHWQLRKNLLLFDPYDQ